VVFAILRWFELPPSIARIMSPQAGATACLLIVFGILQRLRPIPLRRS